MAGVPNIFANATTSIPLAELDANFATPVTIGSTSVALGNTVTDLAGIGNLSSMTLTINSAAFAYQTGTWTPSDGSGAGLSYTGAAGIYTKTGNLVWISGLFTVPANSSGSGAVFAGLPFTIANTTPASSYLMTGGTGLTSLPYAMKGIVNTTTMAIRNYQTGTNVANVDAAGLTFIFQGSYQATS